MARKSETAEVVSQSDIRPDVIDAVSADLALIEAEAETPLTEIEKAELKLKETQAALESLQREAAGLPAQIEQAIKDGDIGALTGLRERQASVRSAVVVASVASRQAQIEVFNAQKADADERLRQAAERLPAEMEKLVLEEQAIRDRAKEIGIDGQRLRNAVAEPERQSWELGEKIRKCEEELAQFLKRESNPEPTPAMIAAPVRLTA
jgi:hypothetical protein